MGFLNKLFGGGTNLELALDNDKVPAGGTVAGSVTLTGGKKPLKLTTLTIEIVAIHVETKEGDTLPTVDLRVLSSSIIAQDRDLAPGSRNKYEFRSKLPDDLSPDSTYKVRAAADIPGVVDPSADTSLTVLGGRSKLAGLKSALGLSGSEDDVLGRFPKLTSHDEDELEEALHDLQGEAYDRDNNFTGVHAFLLRKVETLGALHLRRLALAAWGTVLDNRAKPEHIRALEALAARDLPIDLLEEVVVVAAKFAEEGAMPLVQRFVRHPAPEVRARLATSMYLDADRELPGRREVILELCRDADVAVRAAAFGACASLVEDPEVVRWVVAAGAQDPSPEVQRAALSGIALGAHYGSADLLYDTYLQHAQQNPNAAVREDIAGSLHWLPADPRLTQTATALFNDRSSDVRKAIAWQSNNMSDHPELRDLYVYAATHDPDEAVRADALRGLHNFFSLPDTVAFLRQRLAHDRNEATYWAALNAVEGHMPAKEAQSLLQEIARGPFSRAAERAREVLAGQ